MKLLLLLFLIFWATNLQAKYEYNTRGYDCLTGNGSIPIPAMSSNSTGQNCDYVKAIFGSNSPLGRYGAIWKMELNSGIGRCSISNYLILSIKAKLSCMFSNKFQNKEYRNFGRLQLSRF